MSWPIQGVPTLTVTKSASLTRALRRPRAVTFRGNGQPGRGESRRRSHLGASYGLSPTGTKARSQRCSDYSAQMPMARDV